MFYTERRLGLYQGRSQGGCPRCPGTPLGEKIPEGEYRFENLLTKIKKFFAGGHPPWHISGYATGLYARSRIGIVIMKLAMIW